MISLTFHGHSAWQIQADGADILIDPFFTGNPSAVVAQHELDPTHIVVTHGHGDHLGDSIAIAKRTNAEFISSFEIANYVAEHGCTRTHGLGIGGGRTFDFGIVRLTIAHHGSSFPDGSYAGVAAGVVLHIHDKTIYHAGDTALFADMALISDTQPIDVALLPIGDCYTMGIRDAVRAAELLEPRLVIPMHYNTFPAITVDPSIFVSELTERNIAAMIMSPGQTHTLA